VSNTLELKKKLQHHRIINIKFIQVFTYIFFLPMQRYRKHKQLAKQFVINNMPLSRRPKQSQCSIALAIQVQVQ